MTEQLNAAVAQAGLPGHWTWRVEVRPRRRTLGLEVQADGQILVSVPAGADPADVRAAVRARRLWLANAVGRRMAMAADHPAKEIADGEGFAYLGRHYRLLLVEDQEESVRLFGGWLRLRRPDVDQDCLAAIVGWYTDRGRDWLARRVARWAGRIGVSLPTVSVRDLGTRWGRRERNGSVTFHWAVMQLAPDVADFVVVHELVHLAVARHGDEFQRRVRLALPDADELETELATLGRRLWLGAVRGENVPRA